MNTARCGKAGSNLDVERTTSASLVRTLGEKDWVSLTAEISTI
jgi:hypothetical protein